MADLDGLVAVRPAAVSPLRRPAAPRPGSPGVSALLDEAVELVARRVAGWAALLVLLSLPYRFLAAFLVHRMVGLGEAVEGYGTYLLTLSALVSLALLPAFWGRAAFCRAVMLARGAVGGQAPARDEVLRLAPRALAGYLTLAYGLAFLGGLFSWTGIAVLGVALAQGLAAATAPLQTRAGLLGPLGTLTRNLPAPGPLLGMAAVFVLGLAVAAANLYAAFRLGLWLASSLPGIDAAWWSAALSGDQRLFVLLLWVGALLLTEPFWLAALVVAVGRERELATGADLAARVTQLKARWGTS